MIANPWIGRANSSRKLLQNCARVGKLVSRALLRSALGPIGFDLVRLNRIPGRTMLGLPGRPIRTIIDVGANRGQFAHQAMLAFPSARLYCFEPLPDPFASLKRWADSMPNKVEALNMAIGESEGLLQMQVHVDWDFSSSLLNTTPLAHEIYPQQLRQSTTDVRITTLDAFFESTGMYLEPQILIKIDAQGYDNRVIRGGKATFSRSHACLVEVNLDNLYEDQGTFKEIFTMLDDLGFRYAGNLDQEYASDGHVVFIDAVFLR